MVREHVRSSGPKTEVPLRPPSEVMRLDRMGSAFPTRISFLRTLLRRLAREDWKVSRPMWEFGRDGFGTGVYTIRGPEHTYSLVCFSQFIDPTRRTDRVIAEEWDVAFTLVDGEPSAEDIVRQRETVPKQEAGRFSPKELVISRANKSVRLFEHCVERLSAGRQPDAEMLGSVGYLMRTTAVYGNGKFGVADRDKTYMRPELAGPFQAEMLTVWLIRNFTFDLLDHVAAACGGSAAVALAPEWRQFLGVGNATGLGMAPFLHSHPVLIHNWFVARETAIARVKAMEQATENEAAAFHSLIEQVRRHVDQWHVADPVQSARVMTLSKELPEIAAAATDVLAGPFPWQTLAARTENMSLEAQELVLSLILEPYGEHIDELADTMATTEAMHLEPAMPISELRQIIDEHYDWALEIDFGEPDEQARFWYVSEEKLEPRLGERFDEQGSDLEQPLHVARDVQVLATELAATTADESIAVFLAGRPQHRHTVRRIQTVAHHPYGEIRDNLISARMRPIDMLRCKLAFFGACKFDPKSDRWTRIALYQGVPTPATLTVESAEDNTFAVQPSGGN